MKKIALITGATAGIGEATALKLAADGYHIIGTGRRKEKLASLKTHFEKETGVEFLPLCFDIQDKEAVKTAIANLPDTWKNIEVLVNNAGLAAGFSDFQDAKMEDWDTMIDTNVKGLLYISQLVAKQMIAQKKGHIVNLSSTAGKQVYAKGNIYCATKFAVEAITKALRLDLLSHGIRVSSISPGAVDTEFSTVRFKGDKERADKMYAGYKPLYAADIADLISFVVSRPAHVNVNDLVVTCTAQADAYHFHKEA